jgi:oxidoreductase
MSNKKNTMKAVVLEKPCTADELKIQNIEIPKVKNGWVLIKIKAFGINRAEIFTRDGFSPSVKLPRVIGIECVGVIEDASDSDFQKGDRVFTMMS